MFSKLFFRKNFPKFTDTKNNRNRKNVNQWFPRRGSIWIWSFWIRNDRFWFWWIWMDYYGFYDYYLYYNRFLYIWQEWFFDFFESVECVFIPLSVRVCSFKIFFSDFKWEYLRKKRNLYLGWILRIFEFIIFRLNYGYLGNFDIWGNSGDFLTFHI